MSDTEHASMTATTRMAVLFPLQIEARGFLRRLPSRKTFRCNNMRVFESKSVRGPLWVAITGSGKENAVRGAQAMVDAHQPTLVVMAGLAGALQSELKVFDILLADRVANESGDRLTLSWQIDSAQLPANLHRGRLLSVDRVIASPQEKSELGTKYDALAVDMESFAVAEFCQQKGIPLAVVRVIGDSCGEELPRDIQRLLNQATTMSRAGAALRTVWHRPAAVKQLWNLKQRSDEASQRLGQFLAELIELPPSS